MNRTIIILYLATNGLIRISVVNKCSDVILFKVFCKVMHTYIERPFPRRDFPLDTAGYFKGWKLGVKLAKTFRILYGFNQLCCTAVSTSRFTCTKCAATSLKLVS